MNYTDIMKRILLITGGSLSLSLGVIGIFLPVLPTTPFLLLAAACYLRSSRRLYNWLVNHKLFGRYIHSWITYGALSIRAKVISLLALWLVMLCSVIFFVDLIWLRFLLPGIAVGVSVFLLTRKTLTKQMLGESLVLDHSKS